jgi:flavin reductase (DIM6/NTAB) family NADH-FMN oxidoreductase RutF
MILKYLTFDPESPGFDRKSIKLVPCKLTVKGRSMLSSRSASRPSISLYPTPVILVTSVDDDGKPNIITLAWTGVLCSEPPQIGISMTPARYSHNLIRKSGQFVVNVPTSDILKEVDYCGSVSGRKADKFKETGLTPIKANKVEPPVIKECPISMECMVKNIVQLGSHDLFVGEIVSVGSDEKLVQNGHRQDLTEFKSIVFSPLDDGYYSLGKLLGKMGFSRKK